LPGPAGQLTVLPRPPSWIKGERRGREGQRREREKGGKLNEGKGRVREWKGGAIALLPDFLVTTMPLNLP